MRVGSLVIQEQLLPAESGLVLEGKQSWGRHSNGSHDYLHSAIQNLHVHCGVQDRRGCQLSHLKIKSCLRLCGWQSVITGSSMGGTMSERRHEKNKTCIAGLDDREGAKSQGM